ncbi:DNA damage-inducible protein D [Paraburkholderia sp. GAS32]|uniref:DNA damage-inducible protein D n=1 Tax=Paraburkholderia sp. GAS32 TaxID=3035129 RepID=UPI003D20962E
MLNNKPIVALHHRTFESIKQVNEDDSEFWFARSLAPLLDYQYWRNFVQVIEKAKIACERSGHPVQDHFGEVTKMVTLGSGATRGITDYTLSRYACYLIVQNGDPSKSVIANGQTYFAVQTRRQELADDAKFAQLGEDEKRLAIRNEMATHNKHLAAAAKGAGVETPKEKLRREEIKGKQRANQTHFEVGSKVRQTIQELGGTMPESLPTPETSIKQVEQAQKKLKK